MRKIFIPLQLILCNRSIELLALGNVETSHEISIQALVPISNLETVSSLDQVKFVRAPIVGVADQTILESETEDYLSLLAFLVIIPAAVIAIFYYKKRR